ESLDRLREALARLPTASRADLQAEWRRVYRTEPPARLGRELLIAAVAYRLQEQALGGLSPESQRRLRAIAEQVTRGEEPMISAAPRLKPGTRLLREWQGRTHEVLVGDNGFVWQQARYRSLSHIARAITGTSWSGPVFFGLKPRTQAKTLRQDGGANAAR
ncbi:MAG: hypothetical protein QOG78_820, partial [Rhodospirillaceae bacterium]|nr:hypothetical protein [Rhodospirillaceae bacterium]